MSESSCCAVFLRGTDLLITIEVHSFRPVMHLFMQTEYGLVMVSISKIKIRKGKLLRGSPMGVTGGGGEGWANHLEVGVPAQVQVAAGVAVAADDVPQHKGAARLLHAKELSSQHILFSRPQTCSW